MQKKKGQVTIEFSAILALQLLILLLLIVIFTSIYSQIALRTEYIKTQDSVKLVADYSKAVWDRGAGAYAEVSVSLPESMVASRSYIENNTIDIYISRFGDISEAVPFEIYGTWPSTPGHFQIEILNNGSAINVRRKVAIRINQSAIYFSMAPATKNATRIQVKNLMDVNYTMENSLSCPGGGATCAYDWPTPNYTLTPGDSQEFWLNITGSSTGMYPGHLNISAIPEGSNYPSANFTIPITINIQ